MAKRIFVVGHIGAGKFIFTEALAKQLGWEIVDANPSIERYIGRQTKDILGKEGEAAFNRSQADIISHCIRKENVVVLLEECVVSSEACRKLLSSEFVVYLKVSIPTQLARMKQGRVPSLPVDNMTYFLEKQHQERDAFYEEIATLIVESVGYSDRESEINKIIDEDVNKVIKALEK
jgi:shikimate kinase